MTTSNIVAKNTLMLYGRMFISMIVTLYTSRVVLKVLGIDDFGIYNLVAGVIIMFGFLNNAMAASTQRFLSFESSKENTASLRHVFNVSISIHVLIALLIILIAETIGVWFLNNQLNIAHERMYAANWVFQLSLLSFVISVCYVPYNAAIIANEKMQVFAVIGFVEVLLKLAIVFALELIHFDKLILYSILLFLISLFVKLAEQLYCIRNFDETKSFKLTWDNKLIKKMGSFAGWNLFGVVAGVSYYQGVNIFVNIFFGVFVNAARGIAFQVQGAVGSLITNFQMALAPAITKGYARGELIETFKLVDKSVRFSYYLLILFCIPLLIETDRILFFWLGDVPNYTVIFTQLIIIDLLINSLSGPLHILAQATGEIRRYQLIVSTILLLNLPISYIFLKIGYQPQITIFISIVLSIIALFVRLYVLSNKVNFSIRNFFKVVVFKVLIVSFISVIPLFLISFYVDFKRFNFVLIALISFLTTLNAIISMGLTTSERYFIWSKLNNLIGRNR